MNFITTIYNKFALYQLDKQAKEVLDFSLKCSGLNLRDNLLNIKNLTTSRQDRINKALSFAYLIVKDVMGITLHKEQLMGVLALLGKSMVEMQTGEGKTLVCAVAAIVNYALNVKTYVVTANSYLAKRDAENMGKLYEYLGISCAYNTEENTRDEKKKAYQADIMYTTAQQLGFDFLKDNRVFSIEDKCQDQNFHHIHLLVDEADFILIDEARTPLVLSSSTDINLQEMYTLVGDIVTHFELIEGDYVNVGRVGSGMDSGDFWVDYKAGEVILSEHGYAKLEDHLVKRGVIDKKSSLYKAKNVWIVSAALNALRARYLYKKDVNYLVEDGRVIVIDENTGRKSEGRKWSDGLHQAIEVKEGLKVSKENYGALSITIQMLFKKYTLSGLSGTIMDSAQEFLSVYGCKSIMIPTNKPVIRIDNEDFLYLNKKAKYENLVLDIKYRISKGQPVLIGAADVSESEYISDLLKSNDIEHNLLNARNHRFEAVIIASAGIPGSVTVATSMAGRGTDIILGGNKDALIEYMDKKLEFILSRKKLIKQRITSKKLDISLDKLQGSQVIIDNIKVDVKKIQEQIGHIEQEERFLHDFDNWPVEVIDYLNSIELRIKSAIHVVKEKWDEWSSLARRAGGLYVVGSSRNVSRRIDRQLQGRSGRQGDPGESAYYLSIEDDWLIPFGENLIVKRATKNMAPNERITSKMISKVFKKAQESIEDRNFTIRKYLYQYDAIFNQSRDLFLGLRDSVVKDAAGEFDIMFEDYVCEKIRVILNYDFIDFVTVTNMVSRELRDDDEVLSEVQSKDVEWVLDAVSEYERTFVEKTREGAFDTHLFKMNERIKEYVFNIDREKKEALKKEILIYMDECWVNHESWMDEAKKGVEHQKMIMKEPIHEYQKICQASYSELVENIHKRITREYLRLMKEAQVEITR